MNESMNRPLDELALYADLRPDEHLSSGDLADLRAELFGPEVRATHDDAQPATEESIRQESTRAAAQIEPHQRRQAKRRMLIGLAAAVVMLGVAGIVISAQRSPNSVTGDGTILPPAPSSVSIPPASTAAPATTGIAPTPETTAESQSATQAGGPANLAGRTMFMVPDYLPAGWRVTQTNAGDLRPHWWQRWGQVDASGKVTGLVLVYNARRTPVSRSDQTSVDVTVRGQAGQFFEGQPIDDSVENILAWSESGWNLEVRGVDSAKDLVRQVAESLTLDPQTGTIAFPAAESMGLIAQSDLGFADPKAVETGLQFGPSVLDQKVAIVSRPNILGRDLSDLVWPNGVDQTEITIDGRTAARVVSPDTIYTFWLDHGMFVVLASDPDVPEEELARIVHGIRFTDAAEYQSVVLATRQRTTAELSPWPEFDQVTIPAGPTMPSELTNGLTVSLRTRPGESGANAMCLGSPVMNCAPLNREAPRVNQGGSSITVGDRQIGAVWISNALDDVAASTPKLEPNEELGYMRTGMRIVDNTGEYVTTASIVDDVTTSTGRFVIVSWPVEEDPPTIVFFDDGGVPSVRVTPDSLYGN